MASRTEVAALLADVYYRGAADERARLKRRAHGEGFAFVLVGAALVKAGRTVCDILRDYPRAARVAAGWAFAAWWTAHIWEGKEDAETNGT